MTLIFGIYFLVCPYTFSWESHPTKNMCTQSLALPSRPSCSPQDQLPWDSSRKCPQSLQPALPTSVSLLILFPFPKMSFRTIFKVSHPPPLWSLPWSPLAWNQTFLLKLLILYLNFSWGFYPFVLFIMIMKAYFSPLFNKIHVWFTFECLTHKGHAKNVGVGKNCIFNWKQSHTPFVQCLFKCAS